MRLFWDYRVILMNNENDYMWVPLTVLSQQGRRLGANFWHFSRFPRWVFPINENFSVWAADRAFFTFIKKIFQLFKLFSNLKLFTNWLTTKPLETLSIKIFKQICAETLQTWARKRSNFAKIFDFSVFSSRSKKKFNFVQFRSFSGCKKSSICAPAYKIRFSPCWIELIR